MRSIRGDDCRLPEEESSEKERDNILVFARKRTIDPAEVENSDHEQLHDPLFGAHEREAFSKSLEVHMQPLQNIMSHSKSPR